MTNIQTTQQTPETLTLHSDNPEEWIQIEVGEDGQADNFVDVFNIETWR